MNKIRIGVWVCGDYLTHATLISGALAWSDVED